MSFSSDPTASGAAAALPLHCIAETEYAAWRGQQPAAVCAWLDAAGFQPERGRWLLLPDAAGAANAVVAGLGKTPPDPSAWFWLAAGLGDRLPQGDYRLAAPLAAHAPLFALGWAHGQYRYQRYRARGEPGRPRLVPLADVDLHYVNAATAATGWARDLINTPANDLGPAELEQEAARFAAGHGGELRVTSGAELARGFPLIAAVGQGSPRAARLLDLRFSRPGARRVTLVGKGVCFDSGGLDMKPSAGMALMKKDMGGAAAALATARLLRELDAPLDLRVLVPAVENSVDGNAQRPGDVWRSRKGLTVEITNTDAEGRLVLADALALAGEEQPDLIVDFATLTGAARVALGPELPPIYGGDAQLLARLQRAGQQLADPLWPMPLWDAYDEDLTSRIADLNHAPAGGMAGSITAALFLRRFVAEPAKWIHLDIYGWNLRERPGRPQGAEAQGVRAVAALLMQPAG
ncbi:MAG TPA: leucyl aminopeptidase family protein [Steroidobacteraceae bacterium]|nr:leucyl aminopeptidase family protein [Steroidobacteraceae bacterium]